MAHKTIQNIYTNIIKVIPFNISLELNLTIEDLHNKVITF